tara:strand:- start:22 stop:477 length:456 start_codon:yes stop_codon:yes gene_type:complete
MSTNKRKKQIQNFLRDMSQQRKSSVPALPKDLSEFDKPEVVKMFKMLAIVDHGDSTGWEIIRDRFIKSNALPKKSNQASVNASLANQISKMNVTPVDQVMNDMAMDTNDVINMISENTVDTEAANKELEKMKMVEGDMPGQGKHKQGNWRG